MNGTPPDRGAPGGAPVTERRLVVLVGSLLVLDSAMFSALTPLLPGYAATLPASTTAIGVLTAAYSAGLVPGSLTAGWLALRVGVRRTTLTGLVGFAAATAALGWAAGFDSLAGLRLVQGIASGLVTGGSLALVVTAVPRRRRSATIGKVFGAATLGELVGPLLGTAATAVGTRPVFAAVAAVTVALSVVLARAGLPHPAGGPAAVPAEDPGNDPGTTADPETAAGTRAPVPATPGLAGQLRVALRSRPLLLGVWLVTLEAFAVGGANAVLPLRLSGLGASGTAIGLVFLLAAALAALLAPLLGGVADRRGPGAVVLTGLTGGAVLFAVLPLPRSWPVLAVAVVAALGAALTAWSIPAVSIVTVSAEAAGVAVVVATTLADLATAVGESVGAPAAAALTQFTRPAVPYLVLAVLLLGTAGLVLRGRRGPRAPTAPLTRRTP